MHNDNSPEADAHELLLLREQGLLSRRVELGSRVVVEAKLNSKADKTTDETPQRYSLTLRERESEWLHCMFFDLRTSVYRYQ